MKNEKNAWVFVFQKYGKFWSILLGHFIKHRHLISGEWLRIRKMHNILYVMAHNTFCCLEFHFIRFPLRSAPVVIKHSCTCESIQHQFATVGPGEAGPFKKEDWLAKRFGCWICMLMNGLPIHVQWCINIIHKVHPFFRLHTFKVPVTVWTEKKWNFVCTFQK